MDRNLLIIGLGRVAQIALNLAAVRVMTAVLAPSEVGNLFLINSVAGFFGLVLVNPVGMYLNRKLNQWHEQQRLLQALRYFNWYLAALSVLSLPIVLFMHRALAIGAGLNGGFLMLFVALYIYINSWNQTIIPSLNLLHHRASFVAFTLATMCLGLLCSIALVRFVQAGALWWLSGQAAAQAAVAALALAYFLKVIVIPGRGLPVRRAVGRPDMAAVARFVAPLSLTTLFLWMQSQSYRILVGQRVGMEYLGLLALGLSIAANVAGAAESLVQQFYLPLFYREINADDGGMRQAAWQRMARLTLPIYTGLAVFTASMAPFLVNILASRTYGTAAVFIVAGATIELFRMVSNVLASAAHAEMKTHYLMKPYLLGGAAAVAGVFLARYSAGYRLLIPLALAASGLLTVLVMIFQVKKFMTVRIPWDLVLRSAAASAPLSVAGFWYPHAGRIAVSLAVCAAGGAYLIGTQYLVLRSVARREGADARR